MKLSYLITINSIFLFGLGIAFMIYAPLVMELFNVPDIEEIDSLFYWNVAPFIRLFGASQLGFGLLLLAIRPLVENRSFSSQRGIIFALFLTNVLGLFFASTQLFASTIWPSIAGWLVTIYYFLFVIAYGFFLFSKKPE